jgi:hypothetical protein
MGTPSLPVDNIREKVRGLIYDYVTKFSNSKN